ncbi:hypothetical protein LWI28_027346 [Acer negundo]|uniref:Reverse transcriptase domain-containing protein n=1 Tax=Acer negundo TaxID=4023 RepID=A0AAD5J8L7_ACENE|nr:hypothetical protein LWI28_027346 [Acer negundo]
MIANREKLECGGRCRSLTSTIQGHTVTADYFVLLVVACQVVLGVQWLEKLGPIEIDYRQLIMTFKEGGKSLTFKGLRHVKREVLANNEFSSLQGTCYCFQIVQSTLTMDLGTYPTKIADLLNQFQHLFETPSSLTPRSGYHHISVNESDISKTALWTHSGHYEFIVMPFSLINTLATFQSLMNDLFRPHRRRFILVFFDDILVYSKTWEDHLSHLHLVLNILSTKKLFAKESKSRFGMLQNKHFKFKLPSKKVRQEEEMLKLANKEVEITKEYHLKHKKMLILHKVEAADMEETEDMAETEVMSEAVVTHHKFSVLIVENLVTFK